MGNPVFYFWNYLKWRWASEGGEERKCLPFSLADYVWGTHAHRMKPKEQVENFLIFLWALQNQKTRNKGEVKI